jgi:hypothetical protein
MRGSQEDIGKMLVNLGASRTNSVSIYFEKTRTYASLFSRFEMETHCCLDDFESRQSFWCKSLR